MALHEAHLAVPLPPETPMERPVRSQMNKTVHKIYLVSLHLRPCLVLLCLCLVQHCSDTKNDIYFVSCGSAAK